MKSKKIITNDELEKRSNWFASVYDVDQKRILKILKGCNVEVKSVEDDGLFTYYKFTPSIEKAFKYLKPNLVVKLFENRTHDEINAVLTQLDKHAFDLTNHSISNEELCRYEAESYLFL